MYDDSFQSCKLASTWFGPIRSPGFCMEFAICAGGLRGYGWMACGCSTNIGAVGGYYCDSHLGTDPLQIHNNVADPQ